MAFMDFSYSSAEISPRAKRSLRISSAESVVAPGRVLPCPLEKTCTANQIRSDKNTPQTRSRTSINGHQKPAFHPPIGPSIIPGMYIIRSIIFVRLLLDFYFRPAQLGYGTNFKLASRQDQDSIKIAAGRRVG